MNEIIRKIDEEIALYEKRIAVRQGLSYHDESERIMRFEERLNEAIRIKEIIQAKQKEPTEEDLKERYYQAREIIKEFCQFEDCQEENCEECPYPLSTIRCGEEWEFKKDEPKTNGDLIREMDNEELANWIFEKIEDVEWDEDGNNNYEDDIAEWLDEVVGENK